MGGNSITKVKLIYLPMVIRGVFFSLLLLCSGSVISQTFSDDREKFVKEFKKKLSEYGAGEYQDFAKNELPELLLESTDFSASYFSKMVETCNLMESKKLKTFPEIYNYVFSVSSFVKSKQPAASYTAWHNSVDKMLGKRNVKKFKEFIELSAGLFSESRIASSSNFRWFYVGGTYNFEFDKKPLIQFGGGNLVCRVQSKRAGDKGEILDSINIIQTNGIYDPILKKWVGAGGTISWEKVGLPREETYAELTGYDLSLRTSTLRVDTVRLKTPYFTKPIWGILTDRAFNINREEDKVYPQFLSFERKLLIKEIVANVDYVGGFALQGANFVGAGSNNEKAMISLKKDGVPFIRAEGRQIIVAPDDIRIQKAKVAIYLNADDSITHPGIAFTYDLNKRDVQFARTRTGIGQAPFWDTYHQLYIYVPKIIWNIGSDNIYFTYEFGTSQEQKLARFESASYFDLEQYDRLQALSAVHPLVAISKYSYKYDEYILSEGKAATALGLTISQAKPTLFKLSNMGFISYDTENKTVTINKKLETYVRAKAGKRDYDNIVFKCDFRPKELTGYSEGQIENDPNLQNIKAIYERRNEERRIMQNFGVMNLSTFDLDLEAVDDVLISRARNTIVFPHNGKVRIKDNRDFSFNGWINSGKLEVNAIAANFNYDAYKFKLLRTDKSVFRVRPMRKEDGIKSIPMVSMLTGISGEILVDDPENRSGNKDGFEFYPRIISTTSSKVYYNSKDIYRGAYDSTRFYYTIEPFELDSLSTFHEKSFRLKGELTSAGIFPKINEDLKIMPDYSFGFSTESPAGGYPFYGTDAKYDNKIVLSNNGLQGSGSIEFVHSTSVSKALSFLPDSTVGYAQFENRPVATGVEFPDVKAKDAYISYLPQEKMLRVASTRNNDMVFFNEEAKMRGVAIVQPQGMSGIGIMNLDNASLLSNNFRYKRHVIDADTAGFNLKNDDSDLEEDPLAFKTDNVKAHVSFTDRVGEFNSNQGESVVEFPINQYMCKMDLFIWQMDELSIEMQRKEEKEIAINTGVDLVGPNFYSTHPKQDSLQFRAPKAKFDLKAKTIYCEKVEYLDIADARIFPDSMKLNIRKKARIDKLINAKLIAGYITKYHKFDGAEVEINARRDYEAIGNYQYFDKDSNLTYIAMSDIGLDTSYQSIGSGIIDKEDNFKLSDEFNYYGDVSIKAANPLILFSGATRINHSCKNFDRNWMAFSSEIDPQNIQIPVSKMMKDLDGGAISAGIVWHDSPVRDSVQLYPTFLSALLSPQDPVVITSDGFLQYNSGAKEFEIASREKLINRGEKGNYIALHTESCSLNGDGSISLGMDYGDVTVDAVGVINYNQGTGETSMNVTARFDMPVEKGIMQDIATRINEVEGLQPMDFNSTTLEQAVIEWDGVKAADKLKDEFVRLGAVKKVPEALQRSMTITGLRLRSYTKNQDRGLITDVDAAVLVNMFNKPVMSYVPFRAFFQQVYSVTGGDAFTTYIDIPGGRDYFFHYAMTKKDGMLNIKSGDQELTSALTEMKDEKRKKKNFKYKVTTSTVFVQKFMNLFQ